MVQIIKKAMAKTTEKAVKAVESFIMNETSVKRLNDLVLICKKGLWKNIDDINAVKIFAKSYKIKVRDFIKNLDSHKVNFDYTLDFSNIELLKDYNMRKGMSRRKVIIDTVLELVHKKELVTTEKILKAVETKADFLYIGIDMANKKSLGGCLVNIKDNNNITFNKVGNIFNLNK